MNHTNNDLASFQPDYHDHLILAITQRENTVEDEFQLSHLTPTQEVSPIILARIQGIALNMLRKNVDRLLTKRREAYHIDGTHSFILQLEYETRLQAEGPVMFCFSFRICPYSAMCREGLYIQEPGRMKRAWEF
jgi:hypothetical protein